TPVQCRRSRSVCTAREGIGRVTVIYIAGILSILEEYFEAAAGFTSDIIAWRLQRNEYSWAERTRSVTLSGRDLRVRQCEHTMSMSRRGVPEDVVDEHCSHRVSVLVAEQCSALERRGPQHDH
ncbi:MAG TPA: hypothetical protein VJW23_13800, partial [Propionibacteriaceae bacterium]|nr:hypothetical protein [Propionibacteriaceae bacterium]